MTAQLDTVLENNNIKVVFDSQLNLKQIVNKNTDQDVRSDGYFLKFLTSRFSG
jgi:hypothetical protein